MTARWIKEPASGEWIEHLGTDDEWEHMRGMQFPETAEGPRPGEDSTND